MILSLNEIRKEDVPSAGGKGANLGEMAGIGLPVPRGFVLDTDGYRAYLAHSGIGKETAPEHMREALEKGCFPQETEAEIRKAFRALGAARVAVRSSATAEDLEDASFAGQQ